MANPTSAFGWQMPTSTDLVTDLPADFEVFGQAVDTSLADLKGGTTGQVLSKATNADMDFTWVTTDDSNAIQNAIVDAKGDLIAATANDTPARLAVGTNGQSLVADSTTATGLKWKSDSVNTVIDAAGDLLVGTAADTLGRIAIGTNGQVLQSNGTTAVWATPAATTPTFVGVSVFDTAAQSINNGTDTVLTFNSEHFDSDAFHNTSTNTSRLTIPTGKGGKYQVNVLFFFTSNTTGERYILVRKNGTTFVLASPDVSANVNGGAISAGSTISGILNLVATDYLEVMVYQNSGGALNVQKTDGNCQFSISYLGA